MYTLEKGGQLIQNSRNHIYPDLQFRHWVHSSESAFLHELTQDISENSMALASM